PSRHSPSCWTRWVTATRRLATAMPLEVKRSSGSSSRLPTMVVWLSAAMLWALVALANTRLGALACEAGFGSEGGAVVWNAGPASHSPYRDVADEASGCGRGHQPLEFRSEGGDRRNSPLPR